MLLLSVVIHAMMQQLSVVEGQFVDSLTSGSYDLQKAKINI